MDIFLFIKNCNSQNLSKKLYEKLTYYYSKKVAAASIKQQPTTGGGGNKRGSKKVPQQQQVDGEITSTGRAGGETATPPAKPKPKKNEAIICDICSKKFSNAYNLRVRIKF